MRRIPIVGKLAPQRTQRHLVKLPGPALVNDEPRPVITVNGAKPGPLLFVNAGVHGGEYPPIEAVLQLGKRLRPDDIAGTVVLMPVLNLPAFRSRTPFVCPVDGVNPNRVFPGDAEGSYTEQMIHTLVEEFVAHADAYLDLHGGDIPEALIPFSICRKGNQPVDQRSLALAKAFDLPYILAVDKPVQRAKGASSYVAGAERGVPSIIAEAGGVGQLQHDAVELLVDGVQRVMAHLGMLQDSYAVKGSATTTEPIVLTRFDWVYATYAGMWYPQVAAGDVVEEGQVIGRVGDLFGEELQRVTSPASGRVLFLTINPSVADNGLLMGIGVS